MAKRARVIEGVDAAHIPFDEVFAGAEPVILKAAVSGWPMVRAGSESAEKLVGMLAGCYDRKPVIVYEGDPSIKGRFAYNEDVSGFNFRAEQRDLVEVLKLILDGREKAERPYYYMNSILMDQTFPGLEKENTLAFNHPVFETYPHITKIWIGNESTASAHFDIPRNIACCVLGNRRFTLFPPDQIRNLYPGPLSPTPGGQVVTMADLKNPDLEKFPRLEAALEAAVIADLEPGDALYYPSMWWHEVDAMDAFNVMVNYWWVDSPRYMGDPMEVMMHAMLGLRDRPDSEKRAWRELFDYYIFGDADLPRAHLPEQARGALADMNESNARRIRAAVSQSLNR